MSQTTTHKPLFGRVSIAAGTSTVLNRKSKIYNDKELILETDTGKMKIGNGTSTYVNLSYIVQNTLSDAQIQYILNIIKSGAINNKGEFDTEILPDTMLHAHNRIFLDTTGGAKRAQTNFINWANNYNPSMISTDD